MRTSRRLSAIMVHAMVLVPLAAASTGPVRIIFTNDPNDPLSRHQVPGVPGGVFNAGTGTQFDRPHVSPNGLEWVMVGTVDGATDLDVILRGTGPTHVGAFRGPLEGEASPITNDPNNLYVLFRTALGINNAGQYAFAADTNAATTRDDIVVRFNGAGYDLMAQEGSSTINLPGLSYGTTNNAVHILENGNVRFRSQALVGDSNKRILVEKADPNSEVIIANTDVTVPAGQLAPPTDRTIDEFTSTGTGRWRSDADGSNDIYHGDLNGDAATDLYMAVNGTVVGQEGVALPNTALPVVFNFHGDDGSQQIAPYNGLWAFRGALNDGATNADRTDFVYGLVNGAPAVLAATNSPIAAGDAELYDDTIFGTTFFINVVSCRGDYIIGGTTNNADELRDAVLVLNDKTVVARQGDMVDSNDNGLADDSVYIHTFNNDDSFLTWDGLYYFCADVKTDPAATSASAQALVVLRAFCPGDIDRDGDIDQSDLGTLLGEFGTGTAGDLDCDGDTDQADLGLLLSEWGPCDYGI